MGAACPHYAHIALIFLNSAHSSRPTGSLRYRSGLPGTRTGLWGWRTPGVPRSSGLTGRPAKTVFSSSHDRRLDFCFVICFTLGSNIFSIPWGKGTRSYAEDTRRFTEISKSALRCSVPPLCNSVFPDRPKILRGYPWRL